MGQQSVPLRLPQSSPLAITLCLGQVFALEDRPTGADIKEVPRDTVGMAQCVGGKAMVHLGSGSKGCSMTGLRQTHIEVGLI